MLQENSRSRILAKSVRGAAYAVIALWSWALWLLPWAFVLIHTNSVIAEIILTLNFLKHAQRQKQKAPRAKRNSEILAEVVEHAHA